MRRTTHYLFGLLLILCCSGSSYAQQREANVWYFGKFLGIDFNSGAPVPLNDGQLSTTEGVATISNANGALLFYTDGIKVWNRLHQVMPNGSGLFGDPSSSQSAVIVPKPGDTTRYFVFTVDQVGGPRGLCYSIVNMTLDGGKGAVESKNISVINKVTEKVTAVRHCNNRDVWVLTTGTVSNKYYSFLVTAAGVATTPVVSQTGVVLPGVVPPSSIDSSTLGYLKASPDGKKIAAAHWTVNTDVSDFDNATGIVSNTISLFQPGEPRYLSYGVEFSPDSKLVYASVFYTDINAQKKNALLQYDVSLPSPAQVVASKQLISQSSDPIQVYAALQLGPDKKIYMAKNTYKNIAAINSPNVFGSGCNYVSNAVQWTGAGQQSTFGLPTFIQSYFYAPDSFRYTTGCDLNVNFSYVPPSNSISVQWFFDDPASGLNNTSSQLNPIHTFSAAGTYQVMLVKTSSCGTDTLRAQVTTNGIYLNLGADTVLCGSSSLLLSAGSAGTGNSFLWQDGSSNPTFTATTSGQYSVQISNSSGCSRRDTINVTFKAHPAFDLGADKAICQGDTLTLSANAAGATSYLWNDGSLAPTLKAFTGGLYWCEASNGTCRFRDSMRITGVNPVPVVNLGSDQTVCEGVTVTLNAGNPGAAYQWQDGSANALFNVVTSGTYIVQVDLNGCRRSDTVVVSVDLKPRFTLGPDQLICPGNQIKLAPTLNAQWQLQWQDGSGGPTYTVVQPGIYSLSARNDCGTTTETLLVSTGLCKVFVPNGFTPNNDGRNDLFKALGTEAVTDYELSVFERNGGVVFHTTDKTKGWDGTFKGQAFTTSFFVYILRYKESGSNEWVMQKGTVALIR